MKSSKISVIIVTYNAMKWAERCFSSLRKSSVPVEVIVVDNGSTDGTQEYIQTHFPEVDFTQSSENLGFGKANNLGIEKAYKNGADFFYLMNQDAWIFEDSIQKMLDVYKGYPNKDEIGILSPMHLDGTENNLDIFLDKYIATNFEKTRLISDLFCQNIKEAYEISFVNAAHWLLPKSTIETVGGFNPYFFHYGEDNEYVNRVHFHKKKILLCTKSKVVHDGKQMLNKVNYQLFKDLSIETKIMNPALENSFKQEKSALIQSMIKNISLGQWTNFKSSLAKFQKISQEKEQLIQLKKQIQQKGLTFLKP